VGVNHAGEDKGSIYFLNYKPLKKAESCSSITTFIAIPFSMASQLNKIVVSIWLDIRNMFIEVMKKIYCAHCVGGWLDDTEILFGTRFYHNIEH